MIKWLSMTWVSHLVCLVLIEFDNPDIDTHTVDYLKTELDIKPAGLYFSDPSSSSSSSKPIGLEFHSYNDLGHTVTDEEVEDIRKFLKSIFAYSPSSA